MSKTFTCNHCGGVFESNWTEEEAKAEQHKNWGDIPDEDMVQICDDCYQKFMGWAKEEELTAGVTDDQESEG